MIDTRPIVAVALALLALLALQAAPAPAQGTARLGEAAATFPARAVRLTVPQRVALSAGQLQVTENGEPVDGLELVSSTASSRRSFGTVLVIDASKSMQGAIVKAMAATRALAAERSANQQIGVVTFNRTARIRLDLTDDPQAIASTLASPPQLAPRTQLFDAVGLALDQLRDAQIDVGSIVVLSDGADTGSALALGDIAGRARRGGVRIHTIGLRSGAFDQRELESLAAAGQGRYVAATSVLQLRTIFRTLGSELASEYLIRYRSAADPGSTARVAVRIDGVPGVATLGYKVPGDASFVHVEDSFWTSTLGLVAAALTFGLLIALGLAMLLLRRLKGPDLRTRIRSFVSPISVDLTRSDGDGDGDGAERRRLSRTERWLDGKEWWEQFKRDVEIARIETAPIRIVLMTAFGTVLLMYLMAAVSGIPLLGFAAFGLPFAVRAVVRFKRDRQRALFADQLPDMLQGTASAIRAGHGFVGALAIIVEDAPEPSRREFQRVVADEQLGVPLDEALSVVQHRMDSRDVQQVALVAQIQREAGGNSAEVLDRVTEAVRQRGELRRMVRGLTAQGRLSRWVVTLLPVSLLVIISLVNPRYMEPLFETGAGRLLLLIAAIGVTCGSLVIKKIVDFKV